MTTSHEQKMLRGQVWTQGALDALDNVLKTVTELRERMARLERAHDEVANELPTKSEDPDLRLLLRHALLGATAPVIDAKVLDDFEPLVEPTSPDEVRAAALRLYERMEQLRLERERLWNALEMFRDTIDDETWHEFLSECGLEEARDGT